MAHRGRFIVLEGLDGAGTTTQAARLGDFLRRLGRRVHVTAEPTAGPVGSLIRLALGRRFVDARGREVDPAALALLFAADRLDHLASDVRPKLAAGIDVVTDRYVLSSYAYQSAATGDRAFVVAANARAIRPDLTLYLKVRPEIALRRRTGASIDREIYENTPFQKKVNGEYAHFARKCLKEQRIVEIDGALPIDEVTERITDHVRALYSHR
jgi:dTMP kinase